MQQRSPGFHLLSQSSSFGQRNRGGGDEDHLQVPAKGRAPDIKDRTRPLIPKGFTGQDLLVESVVREPIMEDLVDEKKDGSQKSTESNPTTRKKIARMTAGEAHGLEYLCQRPCGPPSRAKTTFKERTQRREPPIHHFQEPYRKGWTISNVHTLGMAQSNYGPLIPSTGLGGHANEHTPSLGQSVTHRFGPPPKSSAITNEGPQHIDGSTSGCLESATGYQSFFKKRTLESNQPATPPLADPMSARHIAHEYAQRRCWQDSIPLEPPMGYREVLEQRGENEHQPPYSPPGPPSRIFKVPKVPPRVNLPATNPIERPMEYRPADPHPGPPSRMFKIPKVTQRVNSSANNPVERPMEYQAAKPSLGHPTTPKNIVNDDLQRLAAAANLAIKSPTSQHRVANERLQGMDHIANSSSSRTVAAGTIPPPLPPSVEEAYKKKCIELKRRMQEVEESNDVFRVRKARLARGIRKMRLERAYLLEMLGKRMKKNGSSVDGFPQPYDEESDGSSEGPPTPHEKPLRSKRSHRRPASSPPPNFGHQHPRPIAPSQAHPTSGYEPPRDGFRESAFQHVPTTNGHTAIHYPPHPSTYPPNSAYQPEPQVMRPRPQPPQSAFFNFLEGYIKRHPEKYPHQTQDELLQVAHRAWEETEAEEYKHYYEDKFQRELRAYEEQIADLERREREGMMEVQVAAPPPPPPPQAQQPREAPAGVGGFTSING